MATPVEHTNGVIGTLYPEDYELKGDSHFTAVTRQLLPYPLITHDERRGLTKRSPLGKKGKLGKKAKGLKKGNLKFQLGIQKGIVGLGVPKKFGLGYYGKIAAAAWLLFLPVGA